MKQSKQPQLAETYIKKLVDATNKCGSIYEALVIINTEPAPRKSLYSQNQPSYFLMHKNSPVLKIAKDFSDLKVLNRRGLPPQLTVIATNPDITFGIYNFMTYAATRRLALDVDKIKILIESWDLSRKLSIEEKACVAIDSGLVSIEDKYWLCDDLRTAKWEEVNPMKMPPFRPMISYDISNSNSSFQKKHCLPDTISSDLFDFNIWINSPDGMFIFKPSGEGMRTDSADMETCVSDIFDAIGIKHVKYKKIVYNGRTFSECKGMMTEKQSVISAHNIIKSTKNNESKLLDDPDFCQMCVADYLISNIDRHNENWGYFYDDEKHTVSSIHPLIDHGRSFDEIALYNDKVQSKLFKDCFSIDCTMLEAARKCIRKIPRLHIEGIRRDMFKKRNQYNSFMEKCRKLRLV